MSTLEFYFDFISPYAYMASTRIEAIASRHGRTVKWRPFRLGVTVTKVMGLKPLLDTPLKGDYLRSDVPRLAQALSIPLCDDLSIFNPVPAQRLFHALPEEAAGVLARKLLSARWEQGRRLDNLESLVEIAAEMGVTRDTVEQALESPQTKAAVDGATRQAIEHGVFGSPTCIVDGELFWGLDRLWILDSFLAAGSRYAPVAPERAAALGMALP
ncbi:2-hydroxychromene-2-carboxylate isomerase [Stutzerimonas stutzeri]|uniref:2-hydroxychromene-2-carboxylate isomerase n=1 Tax=Stutzerimonas stutzeri TaxID=316 RepID=UPI0015E275F2|nr:2-hydroxychromene-2-carboxylate isomerase [Stutzerimonas stutzeri]MBA1263215.1 2-hydroxychromene-2-carboxylate isomerase [Stutzerimonas stutzeri]